MSVPLKGMLAGGIWWSWHYRLQELAYKRQFGKEADDILAQLIGLCVANRPDGHGDDYCITLGLGKKLREPRNWSPPDTVVVVVRLRYVEDLGQHAWAATTMLLTRSSQCGKFRPGAQTAEEHFRVKHIIRGLYRR